MTPTLERPATADIDGEFRKLSAELARLDHDLAVVVNGDVAMRDLDAARKLRRTRTTTLQFLVRNRRRHRDEVLPGQIADAQAEHDRAMIEFRKRPVPSDPVQKWMAKREEIRAGLINLGVPAERVTDLSDIFNSVLTSIAEHQRLRWEADRWQRDPSTWRPPAPPTNAATEIQRKADAELRGLEARLASALNE